MSLIWLLFAILPGPAHAERPCPDKPPVVQRSAEENKALHERFVDQINENGSPYTYFLEKSRQGMGLKGDLTDDEMVILYAYTYELFHSMNPGLRKHRLDEIDALVRVLNDALDKFDDYRGQVKRGAELPGEVLAQHKIGAVVTYDAFTSTSLGNGFRMKHRFFITSKHGKLIEEYSSAPSEQEVLFKSGTKFKVVGRKDFEDGRAEITMEEVDPNEGCVERRPQGHAVKNVKSKLLSPAALKHLKDKMQSNYD